MSDNNAQLFENVLKSMHIDAPFNITMICWRNTPDTVMVSIVDMGIRADVPVTFEFELKDKLKSVPLLSHVSVNSIDFFDINDVKSDHIATEQARGPTMCFYTNGTVTMSVVNNVF